MKIKNNTVSNISVPSAKTRGAAAKRYMVVIGESVLELTDEMWLEEYEANSSAMVKAGTLSVVVGPKLTEEQKEVEDKKALDAARKLIASAEAKAKTTTKLTNK